MNDHPFESAKQDYAIEIYSNYLEQIPYSDEETFCLLLEAHPDIAKEILKLQTQWNIALSEETAPLGEFDLWFPAKIGDYQILHPMSQTSQETICFVRDLITNRFFAMKLLRPYTGVTLTDLREHSPKVLRAGKLGEIEFGVYQIGEEPILACEYFNASLMTNEEPAPTSSAFLQTGAELLQKLSNWKKSLLTQISELSNGLTKYLNPRNLRFHRR